MKGSVNSIETLGLVDGPGIRTIVFLNGCKLRCKYCHNPEMWTLMENNMSAKELVSKIIRNKPYFGTEGGVTFSGGEPLLQSEFLTEVCKLLKKEDIHIALDTAGVGGNYDELLSYIDLFIIDIKHISVNEYEDLTGYKIYESIDFIKKIVNLNKKIWIRQVIIPGVNDSIKYITRLRKIINNIPNIEKVEFIPFHRMGKEKYDKLGIKYPYEDKDDMSADVVKSLFEQFKQIESK